MGGRLGKEVGEGAAEFGVELRTPLLKGASWPVAQMLQVLGKLGNHPQRSS